MTTARELADDYWDFRKQTNHFAGLMRGDLTYIERWNDLSAGGTLAAVAQYESFAAQARALETDDLTSRVLAATVAASATTDALTYAAQAELLAPNMQMGIISWLLPGIVVQPLVTADHGARYLQKLDALELFVNQLIDRLREGVRSGRVPLARHAIDTATKLTALLDDLDSPFSQQAPPIEFTPQDAEEWTAEVAERVDRVVKPALRRLVAELTTTTVPAGRPDDRPGLLHLDGGAELYRRLVGAHTTLDVAPEHVHAVGLAQVARLEEEYLSLAGPLLGTTQIEEIYLRLRTDDSLHHHDADEIIADALRAFEKAQAAMGDWFGVLPRADCVASATEVGALAYYRTPSEDGTQPGHFFFNTSEPSMWATFQVAAIAYHEGIPGHHLQLALGMENENVHPLHRHLYLPGFGEGWGLYTERLADEMGLYEDDWERVGMLFADSLRACRLVVDTGMHALGWTRQQAIDYMVAHSPMAVYEVEQEIDRYIGAPGQATSYMMGRLEIDKIRSEAETELGQGFDVKAFHDAVLSFGTVPLPVLREIVSARLGY
ncbi:MAG: DUF885 domain-containing protein [Acidimicrobiia bacterium]|nr:DUF885 domain-containing protein [Acidimicrobiia bacterium]